MKLQVLVYLTVFLLAACQPASEPVTAKTQKKKPESSHAVYVTQVKPLLKSEQRIYSGRLQARHIRRIFSLEAGEIIYLDVFEGDSVAKGQLLIELDNRRLQAELDKLTAKLQQAKRDTRKLRDLANKKLIATDKLQQAQTQQRIAAAEHRLLQIRLQDSQRHAPFAGLVSQRLVEPGDVVKANQHLLSLIAPKSLRIVLALPELVLSQIALGDAAEVQFNTRTIRAETLQGKIQRIHPTLNQDNQRGTVEIILDKLPQNARSGQSCEVRLLNQQQLAISIPQTALRRDEQSEYVFVLQTDQSVSRQNVSSGWQGLQQVEIREGLKAGQQVVYQGLPGLEEGKKVTVVQP
ncbi:efflux RND transporter periplasmic adaptor subunit [Candidatus Venteria ishoeyi]|uniref:Multidrug resistance protein MdtA n=1 Tax=Candidatus Venteria ishoeyi TaxID=1899563 RepID=A0A1H6FAD3_9GAMM|nr:efflux RND transporter periplasmic adaptor subunit [Candidatus Venteria ishoeyi]SEH06106.1 Multidrug resistance protein MdtA precursor [Candidatus Venteria ishoeyi]